MNQRYTRSRSGTAAHFLAPLLLLCELAFAERVAWPPVTDSPNPEVVTPHIPWARPYPGKPLRALVIGDFRSQRFCIELVQRLSVDCVPFHCPGGAYEVGLGGTEALKTLRGQLQQPFDLVICPGNLIGLFPPDLIELLLRRISDGVGLVYLWPADKPHRLLSELGQAAKAPTDPGAAADPLEDAEPDAEEDAPLDLEDGHPVWERAGLQYLTAGFPLSRLNGLESSVTRDGEKPRPPVTVHRSGKGRAVLIGRPGAARPGAPRLPVPDGHSDLLHEYFMSLVVKAALWVSGREPRIRFTRFHLPQREDGETKLSVTLKNGGAPQRADLTLAVRTERDLHRLPKAPWAQPGVGRSEAVLRPIHSETRSLRLTGDEQTIDFALPPLPRGDYFVDVRASADGKNINWITVPWLVTGDPLIAGISFMPEAVNLAGNTGTLAQVVMSRPAAAGSVLEAVLVDNHHRILRRQEVALNEGTRAVELAFDVAGAKTTLLKLRASIHVNGRALDLKTEYFTVYNRPWPTFTYFAWGCGSAGSSLSRQMHRLAAFHGMDASFSGVGKNTLRVADIRSVGGVAAHHGKVEPGGTIANPCVTSPAYRAGLRNGIRQRAKSRQMSDCFGYTTGDETAYTSGLFAGCGSETCTAHLRSSLKKQYGTIEALNRQWDTRHRSFTEIQPIDDPEAYKKHSLRTGNFSARIDQWLANYDAYMGWFRYLDDALEHYAPRARFGFMTNCFYGHDRGYDFPGMMKICDFASPYGPGGWPPYFDCVQNFGSSGLIFGGHTVTRGLDRFGEDSWKIPFWILLRGGRNAWYYLFTIGGEGAVSPYLDLYPCLDAYSKAVQAVKKGPADLLLGAKRRVDPIAVYYSSPSLIFSSAVSGPKCIIALKPFNRQLRYLGLQGQIIHREQLLSGALKKRGIRVLGLPMVQCVSDREAVLLREFVAAGGLLIADYRPGIADVHGRLFAQEELPKLFGLRWQRDVLLPEGKGMLRIKDGLDRALRLDGAEARGEKDGVPVLTVNKLGKGMAVCLNTPLTTQIYHDLLAEHGITSDVKFEGKKGTKHTGVGWPGAEVNRLTDGEAQYLGITCNRDLKQATIRLKKRGHLYDMLKGEYLGDNARIEAKDFARLVRIFSFLPYRVAALKLECGKDARPGHMIRGTVKVETGGATPVRHVIHFAAHRPDGKTV